MQSDGYLDFLSQPHMYVRGVLVLFQGYGNKGFRDLKAHTYEEPKFTPCLQIIVSIHLSNQYLLSMNKGPGSINNS